MVGFAEFVWEQFGDFVADWVPAVAFWADDYAVYDFVFFFEDVEFKWVVLVYGAYEDFHE